ncbi:guanine nucleotide-releasing factor 2 isoform X3 [Malaya genurostris]|uniref:guanine nucleotide-releasing factor 2 isoform X3 n=1 Tax=Malaya genurostris TaxID=325434 RepID=UPI0026F3A165|nr:guanine nucleotide-releasing factor 2 isoform X3 [Malaya genurostris]
MPEFDDTFLFDCAKFERKKWKSYNINLRPSSLVLKSVGSFSPNNSSDGQTYVEGGDLIAGALKPISDQDLNPAVVVVKKRDHPQRNVAVSYLYSSVNPIREKILGYNFKRHSYTPESNYKSVSGTAKQSIGTYYDNGPTTSSQTTLISSETGGATPRNSGGTTVNNNATGAGVCLIDSSTPVANATNSPAAADSSSRATENGYDKTVTPGAPGSSGHKGSIRGNKLARRARSFKDDFLEKISQIRTPTNTMTRSHSPNSPRSGSTGVGQRSNGGKGTTDDLQTTTGKPIQDLAYHVRQVKNALTHFKDVILKNKLEMLPGNGTVVLELIANVHTALQSYTLNENSSALINATNHVYMSLGNLLKLCDEVLLTADDENCPSLSKENVKEIVELVDNAVNNLVNLANEKISDKAAGSSINVINTISSNTLQRPVVDIAGQRTSLPDIPLTPRERDILEQTSLKTVRASHSTESILRDSSPPPKPPLPDRGQDPPPLPPKRKSQHSKNLSFHETSDCNSESTFLGCGGLDRMSLRFRSPEDNSSLLSASAGSLDSALNHSREEEELRALTHDKSSQMFGQTGGHNSTVWDESDCSGMQLLGGGGAIATDMTALNNRNSNESGFESMYSLRISRDHQSSSTHKSSAFASTSSITTNSQMHKSESLGDRLNSGKVISMITNQQQQQEEQQQLQKINTIVTQASGDVGDVVLTSTTTTEFTSSSRVQKATLSKVIQYGSIEANDEVFGEHSERPPALPVKTRSHSIRRERHPSQYDNVDETELDKSSQDSFSNCSLNQTGYHSRQQMLNNLSSKHISLIEPRHMNHFSEEPPPLPMKKKHIMAYMEIFGSATQNQSEFMRHSVHTYNMSHHSSDHHHNHVHHQHNQTMSMTSGASNHSITHSQTMNLSPSRVVPTPTSPPNSPGLNVKPPALPPKRQRINSKTPSITSTPPASPRVFSTDLSSSPSPSPSQHHITNSCSSPSPSSSSVGTLLPTPPPKNQSLTLISTDNSTPSNSISQTPTNSSDCQQFATAAITKFKVSPVSGDRQLLASNSSTTISNTSISSNSPQHLQYNSFNNFNNNNSSSSSHSKLVSNNIVGCQPFDEDYLRLCDTTTPTTIPAEALKHQHSQFTSDVITSTNLSPTSDKGLLVNQNNNSNNYSSEPGATGSSINHANRKNDADHEDEVEVVLRRNNKNGINLIEQQQSINLMEELDVSSHLVCKKENEDGPDVKGGHPDALIIHATRVQKISDVTDEFLEDAYGEAFITTFRTFISPLELIQKLTHRYSLFHCQMIDAKQKAAKESFSLLVRVVNDLTSPDLSRRLLELLMNFVYQLVCAGHLTMAKLLRVKLIEKVFLYKQKLPKEPSSLSCRAVMTSPPTLLDLKSAEIAEQMTLLDAELFHKIEIPEVLIWAQEQNEERSPNLTRFTEHFNKMSYWARSQILKKDDAKEREKHVIKFIKIMKHLRKINNYNSYLALLSALDSAPIRRLEWHRTITEGLKEYCALIDSSSSFRAYRQALAETNPPCIPYIGLVLQDLTFVHIGNPDLLSDGSINFSKRWQQYHIVVNMKRFKKGSYQFKKNEKIIGFFDNFEDYLDEDAMWQISESIKPRGGRKPNATNN